MRRILDSRPARPLTSREIAKMIGALLGGLAEFCDADEISAAIDFYHAHLSELREMWKATGAASSRFEDELEAMLRRSKKGESH